MAFLGIRTGLRFALLVFALAGALVVDAGAAMASAHAGSLQAGRPLKDLLTAAGRVRPGAHGSFNARGYKVLLGRGGAPRFVRAAAVSSTPLDAFWSESFGNVGAGNASTINAVAVRGADIYVGGSFAEISYDSGITMNNVAEWDGHGWIPLGSAANNGVNGEVYALAASGSTVYVGGQFTSASGVVANAIAKWSGTSWSALGSGMTDPVSGGTPIVRALALSGANVYAGGQFDDAGGVLAHSVAKWSGSSWSALGTGIQNCIYFDQPNHCYNGDENDGNVSAIAVNGSTVYAGGGFNQAGGLIVSGLATWTGSAWSSTLGSAIASNGDGTVYSIALNGSTVYIGGHFDHVGGTLNSTGAVSQPGTAAASIAQWSAGAWHWLSAGAVNCSGCGAASVQSVAYWNGHLYMSGNFYGAGGDGKPNLAQWSGSFWSPVGPNLDGAPGALLPTAGGVLAVGGFAGTVGGAAVLNNIGLWNGSTWSGYGLGLSYGLNAGGTGPIAASNHTLYAGGNYYNAGWLSAHNIAEFNGTSWQPMGTGLSGGNSAPYAILVSGKDVYVGGNFTQAGSTAASNIAMWDGSTWHALGSGVDGTVQALALYDGKLWVGGSFSHAGSLTASDVAIWDPATSTWSAVAGGAVHYDGTVDSLAGVTHSPFNHYMVIGGNFAQLDSGGTNPTYYTVNSIVYLDTTKTGIGAYFGLPGVYGAIGVTTSCGSSCTVAGTVNALVVDGLHTYLGGSFTDGGGRASNGFVDYYYGDWESTGGVGGGSSGGSVNSVVKVGASYFLAGDFTTAGTVTSPGVAQFTPPDNVWSALGSGLGVGPSSFSGPVGAGLAQSADGLYVSGGFGLAGGKAAENLALWTQTGFSLKVAETETPSPVKVNTTATFTGTVKNTAGVSASDVTFTAALPPSATFVSASASAGSCSLTGSTVSCALGIAFAAGASDTVTIKITPTKLGPATVVMNAGESGSSYTGQASTTVIVTS